MSLASAGDRLARFWAAIVPKKSPLLFSHEYDKPGRHHYLLE
jgi:hypothetical protein